MSPIRWLARRAAMRAAALFALSELRGPEEAKRLATAEGFDGLLIMRLDSATVRTLPGLENLDERWVRDVRVRASLVSLKEDREVWTGVIERYDAGRTLSESAPALARAVARRLRAEGLVD